MVYIWVIISVFYKKLSRHKKEAKNKIKLLLLSTNKKKNVFPKSFFLQNAFQKCMNMMKYVVSFLSNELCCNIKENATLWM